MTRRDLNRSSDSDRTGRSNPLHRRRFLTKIQQSPHLSFGACTLALVIHLLLAEPALAEVGTFSPARFKDGRGSLAAAIVFPGDDSAADIDVTLNCDASISGRGWFMANFCVAPKDSLNEYVSAVARGAKHVTLEPALVDGEPKGVWFQYSVTFRRRVGSETVEVFPHHGGVQYSQGQSFSSPQRYYSPPSKLWLFCQGIPPVLLQIRVAPTGDPGQIEFLNYVSQSCARKLKERVDASRYIPAMRNGVAIASSYQELFWGF